MRNPTLKQLRFTQYFAETGNGTQSALAAYNLNTNNPKHKSYASSIATENLKKPIVQQMLKEMGVFALGRIEELSVYAKSESVKLQANQDIANRAGFMPPTKVEHQGYLEIESTDKLDSQTKAELDEFINWRKTQV
jgi:phage terminase small subunit